jgi:peptidoglycan/LPS O-acetylase OafA/YrhL
VPGILLALVYLPTPPAISFDPTFLFPVNPVSWSLFCEIFVNILYALFMVRMGLRSLIWIIIAFGAALLVEKAALSVDAFPAIGPWLVLVDGIPRSLFSFFAGVIIYRLAPNRTQAGSLIIIVLLVAIFALNFGGNLQPIYDLIIIMVVFPALLLFASLTKVDGRQSQVYVLLGTISYPMYVIHMPIVLWVSAIFPRVVGVGLASLAPWSGLALIGVIALVSFLLDRTYDQPVRRWLKMVTVRESKRTS